MLPEISLIEYVLVTTLPFCTSLTQVNDVESNAQLSLVLPPAFKKE